MKTTGFQWLTSWRTWLMIGYAALAAALLRSWSDGSATHEPPPLQETLRRYEGRTVRDAPLLAFVFSAGDCSAALRAGRLWSALHRSGRVTVQGVMLDGPREDTGMTRLLRSEGIDFPVARAADDHLERALVTLGYDTTPVTILTDTRRRPRIIGRATLDSLEQNSLMQLVLAHIDRLSRPSLEPAR